MRQKLSFEIKTIIILLVCILGIRGILYEVPQSRPFIGKYAYDFATRNFRHGDIKQLKRDIQEGKKISFYYLGRGSCSDCKENIKKVKMINDIAKQKYKIDMKYIQLDDSLDESQKSFMEELGVGSIPTLLLVTEKGVKQYDIYDISATNFKSKFDKFIGGEL